MRKTIVSMDEEFKN